MQKIAVSCQYVGAYDFRDEENTDGIDSLTRNVTEFVFEWIKTSKVGHYT